MFYTFIDVSMRNTLVDMDFMFVCFLSVGALKTLSLLDRLM